MTPNINAVLRVGDGRGFVVEHNYQRYVITAAHCLTRPLQITRAIDEENEAGVLPPPMPAMHTEEKTYANLLGPRGGDATVWAELMFADPVADIAVLGSPDRQERHKEAVAFNDLVNEVEPFMVATLPPGPIIERSRLRGFVDVPARLLSLVGEWIACRIECFTVDYGSKTGLSRPVCRARQSWMKWAGQLASSV